MPRLLATALTPPFPTRAVKVAAALACQRAGAALAHTVYHIAVSCPLTRPAPLLVMVAPPTVQQKIKNASAWVLPKLPQLLHT